MKRKDFTLWVYFPRNGFTKEAEDYLKETGIAYTSDERWLDI
ncbi:MAG: hypothetical protein ACM3SY_00060 [Candidatus Omnitrophota bacterium]